MPRNVEIKARVEDPEDLARRARQLAGAGPQRLVQHDVFFHCRQGRIKLRRFADGRGELIAYRRADATGPETSHYHVVPVADPPALAAALTSTLGVLGEVRKTRRLWLAGRTRIHLDEVAGLGHFVELEVVLEAGEAVARGTQEAEELMAALAIEGANLVSAAYVDLLAALGGRD
jgi:predicted adenylyl cyclase CyaB